MTIGILFVCTANTCRSPMAEGVFRTLARLAGLEQAFAIASAGTAGINAGEPPTPAAVAAAARRGYDIAGQRSRTLTTADIAAADYVLAMDRSHMVALRALAPCNKMGSLQMLTRFGPVPGILDVQDPYGGTPQDYERALDLIEAACKGLLVALAEEAKASIAK